MKSENYHVSSGILTVGSSFRTTTQDVCFKISFQLSVFTRVIVVS